MSFCIKQQKGQALTEMVIVIPIFALLFAGVFEFSRISMERIKLAMVEREAMSVIAYADNMDSVKSYLRIYADKIGMDGERVSLLTQKKKDGEMGNLDKLNLLSRFSGVNIIVAYKYEPSRLFSGITGRNEIILKTRLFTSSGGSFQMNFNKGNDKDIQIDEAFTSGSDQERQKAYRKSYDEMSKVKQNDKDQ